MATLATVHLPGGVWRAETRMTEVQVRPPNGHDEEWLAERIGERPIPLTVELLARCVADVGGVVPTRTNIEALTVGDREALVWHLRWLTFGDRIDAVVECSSCGEKLDVPISIEDLLIPSYENWAPTYTDSIGGMSVDYRLPTGRDQATATSAQGLVASCLVAVDGRDATVEEVAALVQPLGDLMAKRDPQAETELRTSCAACGSGVNAILDASSFLLEELIGRGRYLAREVHTLAWHYHWSEHDILAMSADRRRTYLGLIADAYEGSVS